MEENVAKVKGNKPSSPVKHAAPADEGFEDDEERMRQQVAQEMKAWSKVEDEELQKEDKLDELLALAELEKGKKALNPQTPQVVKVKENLQGSYNTSTSVSKLTETPTPPKDILSPRQRRKQEREEEKKRKKEQKTQQKSGKTNANLAATAGVSNGEGDVYGGHVIGPPFNFQHLQGKSNVVLNQVATH